MSNSQSAHDVTACDDDDGYGEIGVYARRTGIVAAAGDIHQDSHLVHEMCWRCACLLYAHTEMLMPILMFRLFVFFVCLFFSLFSIQILFIFSGTIATVGDILRDCHLSSYACDVLALHILVVLTHTHCLMQYVYIEFSEVARSS